MGIIVFDITGKFAHFRKFYTNSSSMTYDMIPRVTLAGMISAMLGLDRDSYYDIMSSDNLCITSRKLTDTYKIMQTLNYTRATSADELIKQKQHTQIPLQILTGKDGVGYRVYLQHKELSIMTELSRRLKERKFVYNIYFGSAKFNTKVNYVGEYDFTEVESKDFVRLHIPIRDNYIEQIDLSGNMKKEKMVTDFDVDRKAIDIGNYIYSEDTDGLNVKLNRNHYELNNGENIIFM